MSAGPSWYDVLGVDPAADTDEIRAAWRAQSADLDPTDRRFRSLSQAAEVLLDPQSRAAYDASLAEPATPAPPAPPAPPATAPEPVQAPKAAKDPEVAKPPKAAKEPRPEKGPTRLPLVPAWVLLAVAVLTALALATATVAAVRAGEPVNETQRGGRTVFVEQSAEEARAAAVRAIVPVLSYDYRTLEEDAAAARSYMTSGYQEDKYDPLFAFVSENAPNTQTVVEVQVVDSAIVRTSEDGDRVEVLLFVDRPTTNRRNTEPVVYKDQATVTMAKVDGQWLVDDLRTSPIPE